MLCLFTYLALAINDLNMKFSYFERQFFIFHNKNYKNMFDNYKMFYVSIKYFQITYFNYFLFFLLDF